MTAMDEVNDNNNLYLAQSNFVGKLKKIAVRYDVVIVLVAHPRKSKDAFVTDDVSGSADITNKVDYDSDDSRESFVKVAFGRQAAAQKPLVLWDLNPCNPKHRILTVCKTSLHCLKNQSEFRAEF